MSGLLFSSVTLGALTLRNRVIMAPMTRDRAGSGDVPTALMAQYYAQRAGAGLIVTEGVQPTPEGKGYWRTPGIHSAEQIAGWQAVANAVHARSGLIAMQLMHCGRVSHPSLLGGATPVAPSAIRAKGKTFVNKLTYNPPGKGPPTQRVDIVAGARNDREQEVISGLDEGAQVLIKPPSAEANEFK